MQEHIGMLFQEQSPEGYTVELQKGKHIRPPKYSSQQVHFTKVAKWLT